MAIEIGAYEAKTKLPQLLRDVKEGKSYTITHRGQPVADLVPTSGKKMKDVAAAIRTLTVLKSPRKSRRVDIKALIERGRR